LAPSLDRVHVRELKDDHTARRLAVPDWLPAIGLLPSPPRPIVALASFRRIKFFSAESLYALFSVGLRQVAHMYSDLFYSFIIGFVGAILFLLVDKYEPEGPLARLLKFLILFVAGVAILHKLQPYGLALF
jgi:hypothetical protein